MMIGGLFQEKTDRQLELTGEERAEAIKITFDDGRVKEMLKGKEYKVMRVKEYRFVKPMMPEEVSEEDEEEAIKTALSNESVIAKIEGLEYEIVDVFALEKIMTEERVETDVYIHVNGTTTCYIARVNLRGGEVIGVTEAYRG